jgi:mannose-6-phosphate isomerase-like protein (cupin superfamily)
MRILTEAGRYAAPPGTTAAHWAEQLHVADLSVGTYSIPRGGTDDQAPHTEDEIYVITAGQAVIEADGQRAEVGPGSVIYVPAHQEHRFADIAGDLAALVLFAPAEASRSTS